MDAESQQGQEGCVGRVTKLRQALWRKKERHGKNSSKKGKRHSWVFVKPQVLARGF